MQQFILIQWLFLKTKTSPNLHSNNEKHKLLSIKIVSLHTISEDLPENDSKGPAVHKIYMKIHFNICNKNIHITFEGVQVFRQCLGRGPLNRNMALMRNTCTFMLSTIANVSNLYLLTFLVVFLSTYIPCHSKIRYLQHKTITY